jgi:hypothetical protein
MSRRVTQTRQLCQSQRNWPKKEIESKLPDLADFNGFG